MFLCSRVLSLNSSIISRTLPLLDSMAWLSTEPFSTSCLLIVVLY